METHLRRFCGPFITSQGNGTVSSAELTGEIQAPRTGHEGASNRSVRGQFVVMDVSGCGKSSVARGLASRTAAPLLDADDFHYLPVIIEKLLTAL